MLNMLIWFAVVLVLFAVGDLIAKLTHARISSVFATLMLFLILFVTGIIPSDIIDRAGLTKNTLVAFASDNGLAVGRHGFMGKQNPFEHSLKVPLILAGPGIPQGQTRRALVYLQDLRPTLLDLAGLRDDPTCAFRSFAPLLRPGADPDAPFRDALHTAYRTHWRTLRQGDWKLIRLAQGKGKPCRELLFDLRADPLERRDLAQDPANAQRLAALRQTLLARMRRTGDPLAAKQKPPQVD